MSTRTVPCFGCEHCGCDPNNPDDYCFVCERCPDDINEDEDDLL